MHEINGSFFWSAEPERIVYEQQVDKKIKKVKVLISRVQVRREQEYTLGSIICLLSE